MVPEYRIGCLPIGGYVHMLGEEDDSIPDKHAQGLSFTELDWFKKSIVALAGPLAANPYLQCCCSVPWVGTVWSAPYLSWAHHRLDPDLPRLDSRGERVPTLGWHCAHAAEHHSFDGLHWRLAQLGWVKMQSRFTSRPAAPISNKARWYCRDCHHRVMGMEGRSTAHWA